MPYVIVALSIVNAVALAATYLLSSSHQVFSQYGFTPAHPHTSTLFASMFLHAGVPHLLGNLFFLWMFGYRIENTFGRWLFGAVYLLSGAGAAGLHYLFNLESAIPCIGASGAISGVMGCYFVLFPKSRFDLEVFLFRFHLASIPTHTHGAIGIWVGEQAILGLLTQALPFSSTAFWAHVGGFGTGCAAALLLLLIDPQIRQRGAQPFMVRSVKGVVHDLEGHVLPNARVELLAHSREILTATTDRQGRFSVSKIPEGSYTFNVSRFGWQSVQGSILVRKKTRYSVPIKIRMQEQKSEKLLIAEPPDPVPQA